ncbi:MAG TPA: hypothetical protein VM818_08485 [Vicinamibacterales bacterium]|nr:hypothetical protein [Vicinamibacterales bacterium]
MYADTGEEQGTATLSQRDRAAASWTGQPASAAVVQAVTEIDQWMVGTRLMNLRPLWKYSWSNGEQLYIGDSGEVLQYTTRSSRLAAYASAIPHWLYFTPLRKHQPVWIRLTTYAAMIGTVGAIVGVVLGVWLYSPSRKYRFAGEPSRIPFRGQKRWHTILGLIFGVATVTWTFSGSLAFLPFPTPQRAPTLSTQARPPQGRGGGGARLAAALRGRARLDDFAPLHPRDLLARHAGLNVKELQFTSFAGQPLYAAQLGDGTERLISLDGALIDELDRTRIVDIVKNAAADQEVEIRVLDRYDRYYLDRTGQQPLPVILALIHDAEETRHYIDPKTATIVRSYGNRNAARRWLYNGLHSLNFPWLYNYRPLWDIVVIAFMIGGTALCVTGLVLAWRAVGKKLRRLVRTPKTQGRRRIGPDVAV